MKKNLALWACASLLLTACKKDHVITPSSDAPKEKAQNLTTSGSQWDIFDATYTQYQRNGLAKVTFGVTVSAAIGSNTGAVFIATADNANQITSGWSGPYTYNNFEASFYPGSMYVNGLHVAILCVPSTNPPTPTSQIGYTINSTANDHMDVAIVQTLP